MESYFSRWARVLVGQIVHGDEFDVRIAERSANHIASDTAEAVDSYFHCHINEDLLQEWVRGKCAGSNKARTLQLGVTHGLSLLSMHSNLGPLTWNAQSLRQ